MVVIVGNNNYAVLLSEYIQDSGKDVCAFAVEKEYIVSKELNGKPVISLDSMFASLNPKQTKLIMGIGYRQLGEVRKKIFLECKEHGFMFDNYIHPTVLMDRSVVIGEGNTLFENVVLQKNTKIGDANLFWSNSVVMHDGMIGSFNTFGAGAVINGAVSIDNCTFVGSNATVKDHIQLAEHTLVGAGAYVRQNTEKNTAVLPSMPILRRGDAMYLAEKL